jgi:KDO2-lipid IV(A) lauroyltransferase
MARGYRRFWLARQLGSCLPLAVDLWLAERLADGYCAARPAVRERVRARLSRVLERPLPAEAPIVREVFRNFARYVLEWLIADRLGGRLRVEGVDRLAAAIPSGQAAIVLTGHLGNWELGAAQLGRAGLPVSVVALPHEDAGITRLYDAQRRRHGLDVVPLDRDSGRHCLQALRRGRVVGLVGDRDFGETGIAVPFLGQPTLLPRGPAVLSCRSGAPVVPMFLIREAPWRFRLFVEPPIPPRGADGRLRPVEELTAAYAAVLEGYVRRFPEQWIMF